MTKKQWEQVKSRFLSMVSDQPTASGCRAWEGYIRPDGYGSFALWEGRSELAHRVAYAVGKDQPSFLLSRETNRTEAQRNVVRHVGPRESTPCDFKHCVEFKHLALGTQRQNIDDSIIHGTVLKGEDVGNSVLTEDAVRDIRTTAAAFPRSKKGRVEYGLVAALAQHFSVTAQTISQVIDGAEWWRHVEGSGQVLDLKVWNRAGERNSFAKLTAEDVKQMRELAAAAPRVKYGASTRLASGVVDALAKKFKVAKATVWQVLNESHWRM